MIGLQNRAQSRCLSQYGRRGKLPLYCALSKCFADRSRYSRCEVGSCNKEAAAKLVRVAKTIAVASGQTLAK